jgi:N6-adenosine-specific RNA methylase IME4
VKLPATKICLDLSDNMPFEEWRSLGMQLAEMEKGIQWWVGDWWAFGGQAYGERAKAVAEGIFNRAFPTLVRAGTVARAFTSDRRRSLSWAHHAEVAALPAKSADRLLDEAEVSEWSTRDLRAAVNRLKTQERIAEVAPAETCTIKDLFRAAQNGVRFGTIYADPPWQYDNQGTRAATGNHYTGMSVDELCALPVKALAADAAHLHLWTTNGFLFECPKIFDAWGFEFKSSFVWVKPKIGIGNYWRNSHELLLTAVRGAAKRFNDHSLCSWFECDRGEHSSKPEQVRDFIEKASPAPRLEMFARHPADGWTSWGNQIEQSIFAHGVRKVA